MPHGTKPTTLLIEADTSLRRLIALGLQYRGMHVIESDGSNVRNLPDFAAESLPDLLVIDVDGGARGNWSLLAEIESLPKFSAIPIIALTWEAPVPVGIRDEAGEGRDVWNDGYVEDTYERVTFLTKPFDARALYATAEQLLAVRSTNAAQQQKEMAVAGRATSMSIWPLLTAAGLLLAFIGLMGELPLIIIGLLIVIVSLLWWTLGSKPERAANAANPMRVERPYPSPVS